MKTKYAEHKYAMGFLLDNYKKSKVNFKKTYGVVKDTGTNFLALPGREKSDSFGSSTVSAVS